MIGTAPLSEDYSPFDFPRETDGTSKFDSAHGIFPGRWVATIESISRFADAAGLPLPFVSISQDPSRNLLELQTPTFILCR